jgi:hypothetical protein
MELDAATVAADSSAAVVTDTEPGCTGTISTGENASADGIAIADDLPVTDNLRSRFRGAVRSSFRYSDTFADFGPDEMRMLVEAKRFFECYQGDRAFREAADAGGKFTDEQRRMLKDIGVTFEPEAMELVWTRPDLFNRTPSLVVLHPSFEEVPSEIHAALAPYPEMRIWLRWRHRSQRMLLVQKLVASSRPTLSPEYTTWRARRVAAVRNELGSYGWALDHPCHAVEMAVGCSVGCGFCAFDAGKLQTVFDLGRPENRELVRGVATGMANVLGWPAAHGMLYWSTEPHDNPHYVKLLEFWHRMTGAMLCTATARAGEDWVRELIDFYSTGPVPWPRISVLSRGIMRRLHGAFTPMELRDTALLMQQKDAEALRAKVPGGRERMLRQLVEADDLRNVDFENLPEGFEPPQGSIACISGPLVNMVNRTMKLISPCYTTMEYRYGYRVFDETTFDGPEDFEVALKRMVRRSMVVRPYPEMPMRWRDDLKAVPQPDGFTLLSPTTRRDFRRGELHLRTAELIGRGDRTYEQVFEALSDNPRVGPMAAISMLDSLFRKGYLCELAITRDYRARQETGGLREPVATAA